MGMHDFNWSPGEKQVARKAFEKALQNEKDALILTIKERAAKIVDMNDVWDLHRWIGMRGKEIDEKYDYRYSQLPLVFARLMRERDLVWEDLSGFGEDKMEAIRQIAAL